MKRKLIKQGAGGLTICLPKRWTEKNNLGSGDEIDVEEAEDKLIIGGKGAGKRKTIKVNIPATSKSLAKSIISNAYKKGYDIIEVIYEDDTTPKMIEKIVHELMGYEIMDKKKHILTIKNISIELEEEYDNFFRKTFYLCLENISIIKKEIKNSTFQSKHDIEETRDLITKYTDYCKRIISKNKRQEETAVFEYLMIWTVEKISNEIIYLYRYLYTYQPKLNKEDIAYLEMAFHLFETIMDHYFKKNVAYLQHFGKEKDDFLHKTFDELMAKPSVNKAVLHRAGAIVRRCHDLVGPFYGKFL